MLQNSSFWNTNFIVFTQACAAWGSSRTSSMDWTAAQMMLSSSSPVHSQCDSHVWASATPQQTKDRAEGGLFIHVWTCSFTSGHQAGSREIPKNTTSVCVCSHASASRRVCQSGTHPVRACTAPCKSISFSTKHSIQRYKNSINDIKTA